jgi:hypothetical protein
MKRSSLLLTRCRAAAVVAVLALPGSVAASAQTGSQGENFSAGKTPAQLFASDCTGSGCHKGPQGLGRKGGIGIGGLSGFLREHYTNSRESAAALANYLAKLPAGPEPREARRPRDSKPAETAAGSPAAAPLTPAPARWFEGVSGSGDSKPAATSRQNANAPAARGGRTAARPDAGAKPESDNKPGDDTAAGSASAGAASSGAASSGAASAAAASAAVVPPLLPPPAAAPEPEPAPPPPPKQFDIFD